MRVVLIIVQRLPKWAYIELKLNPKIIIKEMKSKGNK